MRRKRSAFTVRGCTANGDCSVIILIFHFFVPFFLLLSRDLKRNPSLITKVAAWIILMRFVDLFWLTRPEFTSNAMPSLWDLGAVLALGGLWLFYFAWQLQRCRCCLWANRSSRISWSPMSTDIHHSAAHGGADAEPRNDDVSFETSDVHASTIYWYLGALAVA